MTRRGWGPGRLIALGAAAVACLAMSAGRARSEEGVNHAELAKAVDAARLRATVERLASMGSRVPGYAGNSEAVSFVVGELKSAGISEVWTHKFELPVPIDKGSRLTVATGGPAGDYALQPIWPNLIRTSTCSVPGGADPAATAPLIYAKGGHLADYNGLQVQGAVVLLDFSCGLRWLDAANLGARAVLFVEPEAAMRGEAEEKFLKSPLDLPRFWIGSEAGARLIRACADAAARGESVGCRLSSKVDWELVCVENVVGMLRARPADTAALDEKGKEAAAKRAKELLVLGTHLDSASVVPSLAPGAECAGGAAVLLELARIYAGQPLDRDALFLFTNAHYLNLKGMRFFYDLVNTETIDWERASMRLEIEAWQSRILAESASRRPEFSGPGGPEALKALVDSNEEAAKALSKRARDIGADLAKDPQTTLSRLLADTDEEMARWVGDVSAQVEERLRTLRLIEDLSPAGIAERDDLDRKLQVLWRTKDRIRGFSRYEELSPEEKAVVEARYNELRKELVADLEEAARDFDRQRSIIRHNLPLRGIFDVKGVDAKAPAAERCRYDNVFYMGLDLSSRSSKSGLLFKGKYFNQSTQNMERFFSAIGERANLHARTVETALGLAEGACLVDAIRVVKGWTWDTFIPESGNIGLDVEIVNSGGENGRIPWKGLAVVPVNDSRVRVDTPHDLPAHVDWAVLESHARFAAPFLRTLLSDDRIYPPISLNDNTVGPVTVTGDIVRKGGARSVFADRPVPGALVVRKKADKSFMGVMANDVVMTDRHGRFALVVTRNRSRCDVEVYGLDPQTGRIIYAHDKGQTATATGMDYYVRVYSGQKTARIPVFRCESMAVVDLLDQRFLKQLTNFSLIDARSESVPQAFGNARPETSEPVLIIFGKPDARLKITVSAGQLGVRMALLNIDPAAAAKTTEKLRDLNGTGWPVSEQRIIAFSSYRAARDMFFLDDWRIRTLVEHSIENKRLHNPDFARLYAERGKKEFPDVLPGLHDLTRIYLDEAETALANRQYDVFVEKARSAWATESRAYPDVRGTQNDTVVGVIFYLFLVLPFCYFLERLVFGFVKIEHQILGFFGIFVAVFAVLRLVHPAFQLTKAPTMVLLAFIILALSVIVIGIIYGKFATELKALRETRRSAGQVSADVNRASASAVAVSLGISQMRRRKVRTLLTTMTIVILTFTALSFTSVVTSIKPTRVEIKTKPAYEGILIKDQSWSKIEEPVYRILRNCYANARTKATVSPRSWYISEDPNKQTKINVARRMADGAQASFTASGVMGMSIAEKAIFSAMEPSMHEGSAWFSSDSAMEVILPDKAAEKLGLTGGGAGANAEVEILGARFRVVGIVDTEKFDGLRDLNDEAVTPVDYVAQGMPTQQGQSGAQTQTAQGALLDAALGKRYEHYSVAQMVIMPYDTVMKLGGTLRSVAIRFPSAAEVKTAVEEIKDRMEVNFYAGTGEKAYLYASVGSTSLSGLKNLIIPILIASLIIFNTMVGSVYERNREIHIFSSLGLAPMHVSALFLTESVVYATLGAMSGYLIGQAVAKLLTTFDLLQGLTLNYSSLSTVSTTMIVMAAVVGSTIYPALQAARIAVPSAERRWSVPQPDGDRMLLDLPFTFPHEHLLGIGQFMYEFFSAHIEATIGRFYIGRIHFDVVETPLGEGYCLYFMAWLTPYDLGVSQEVQVYTVPTPEGSYVVEIALYRASGYVSSWMRTNLPFLNTLRKQFLLWRTLTKEQRDGLQADGRGNLVKLSKREVRIPESFAAAASDARESASGQ